MTRKGGQEKKNKKIIRSKLPKIKKRKAISKTIKIRATIKMRRNNHKK